MSDEFGDIPGINLERLQNYWKQKIEGRVLSPENPSQISIPSPSSPEGQFSDLEKKVQAATIGETVSIASIPTVVRNRKYFITFQVNVPTAGTAVRFPFFDVPDGIGVVIKAHNTNNMRIKVGRTATEAQNKNACFFMLASERLILYIENTQMIWIDAENSGEGVELIMEQ